MKGITRITGVGLLASVLIGGTVCAQDVMSPEEAAEASRVAYDDGDYRLAGRLALEACDGGSAVGCARYAYLVEWQYVYHPGASGTGATNAMRAAGPFYQRACEGGYVEAHACEIAGSFYSNGLFRELDLGLAERYYGIACDAGYENACAGLAAVQRRIAEQASDQQ